MKLASFIVLAIGLGVIGACALVLRNIDENRVIGDPGLVMIDGIILDEDGNVVNTNTVALPESVLNYDSTNAPITRVELGWLPEDTTYARRLYQSDEGQFFQVNVVMMGRDRSSIHKPQICLTGQGWSIESELEDGIVIEEPFSYTLPVWKMVASQEQLLEDGSSRELRAVYTYWFVADDRITARHGERMFWSAKELISTGLLQRWAYVSVLGLCAPGQEEMLYKQMREFIVASVPRYHRVTSDTVISEASEE